MNKQLIVIEKAKNSYSVYSPLVDGCIATGNSREDALDGFLEALVLHASGLNKELDNSLMEISELHTKIIRVKKLCTQIVSSNEVYNFQEEVMGLLESNIQEKAQTESLEILVERFESIEERLEL